MPWINHPKPLSRLKLLFVPHGRRRRRVVAGAFRGLNMEIDLRYQTQLFLGLHERETYPYLRALATGIRSAIDVGAAEGEYTLFFVLRTDAESVLAVEPVAEFRDLVKRNLDSNRHRPKRVELCPFFIGADNSSEWRTLDSMAGSMLGPCLVKVDVEGGEVDVLRGARAMLVRPDVRWLIETHSQELERRCIEILSEAGYAFNVVPNSWWRILVPENRAIPHNRWLVARKQ